MALLDLPHPLFALLETFLATLLPPAGRLVAWALLASLLTLGLYRLLSPQARIARVKRQAKTARRRLYAYDGDLAGAGPLITAQLGASMRHLGLVLPATLLAVLPLLGLLSWLDTAYGMSYPPAGQAPAIRIRPAYLQGQWVPDPDDDRPPVIRAFQGDSVVSEVPLKAPVTTLERRQWWHWLAGNPAGYLPDDGPIERIEIDLPVRRYLGIGPEWARTWPAVFLPAFLLFSLLIYRLARIQ